MGFIRKVVTGFAYGFGASIGAGIVFATLFALHYWVSFKLTMMMLGG